jgi:hypothetical protein
MLSSHSCCDEFFPPVSLPDMLHKVCLSQNRHRLVLTNDLPLEAYCWHFDPGGVPGPTSELSLRVPAQMGWRGMEHKMWDKPCIILH